jgi:hypothetical protein
MGSRRCRRRRRGCRGRRRDHCLAAPWLCGLPRVCPARRRPRLLLGIPAGLRSCRARCWLYRSTRPGLPRLCWASLMRGRRKVRTVLVAVTVALLTVPANSQGCHAEEKALDNRTTSKRHRRSRRRKRSTKPTKPGLIASPIPPKNKTLGTTCVMRQLRAAQDRNRELPRPVSDAQCTRRVYP